MKAYCPLCFECPLWGIWSTLIPSLFLRLWLCLYLFSFGLLLLSKLVEIFKVFCLSSLLWNVMWPVPCCTALPSMNPIHTSYTGNHSLWVLCLFPVLAFLCSFILEFPSTYWAILTYSPIFKKSFSNYFFSLSLLDIFPNFTF